MQQLSTTVSGEIGPNVGRGFAMALNPETAEAAMKCADWMSKSDLVPKGYHGKPHDIVIAAAMGARLGLDPFSALAGIAVINGRPTLWGDSMLAVCQHRNDWGGMEVKWDGEGDTLECTVSISRKGNPPYSSSFSVADAKTAGLWKKQGPWTSYPRRMLELRARSYALRGAFADALAGFHSREEMEDITTIEADAVVTVDPPPAKKRDAPPSKTLEQEKTQEQAPTAKDEPIVVLPDEQKEQTPTEKLIATVQTAVANLGGQGKAAKILGPIAKKLGLTKFADAKPEDIPATIKAIEDAVADAIDAQNAGVA
jgi:hypothetical protein